MSAGIQKALAETPFRNSPIVAASAGDGTQPPSGLEAVIEVDLCLFGRWRLAQTIGIETDIAVAAKAAVL